MIAKIELPAVLIEIINLERTSVFANFNLPSLLLNSFVIQLLALLMQRSCFVWYVVLLARLNQSDPHANPVLRPPISVPFDRFISKGKPHMKPPESARVGKATRVRIIAVITVQGHCRPLR